MSSDLEETFHCIFDGKVPSLWGKVRNNYVLDKTFMKGYDFSVHFI